MATKILKSEKRGDTLIEVMFAIAVFAMVAIISISMMNSGVAGGERSLELVTARNEINAQAEALRFIHSAYASELVLPECSATGSSDDICQQYRNLWKAIIDGAKEAGEVTIPQPLNSCQEVYENDNLLLTKNDAFIINTRTIGETGASGASINKDVSKIYIKATSDSTLFSPAPLGARIVYVEAEKDYSEGDDNNSAEQLSSSAKYNKVGRVEGIWDFAVKGGTSAGSAPRFYDFYIQACWYGSNAKAPTTIDTVIRLYNPDYKNQ